MELTVTCTGCGKLYAYGPELAGKRMRCRQCGTVFQVPVSTEPDGDSLDFSAFEPPEAETAPNASGGSKTRMAHPGAREGDESDFSHGENAQWADPVSRAALRFNFPFAAEIDRFLPP